MPLTVSVPNSGNPDIDGILSGTRWGNATVTYSFVDSQTDVSYFNATVTGGGSAFAVLPDGIRTVFRFWLNEVASLTNLNFQELTGVNDVNADLRAARDLSHGTAYAYYPSSGSGGDSYYGPSVADNPLLGSWSHISIGHELGHALGLKHGHETPNALPAAHDSYAYSIMTYNGSGYESNMPTTYMQNDIAALQYLYGADFATRSGNTTYSWNPTTGETLIDGVSQGTRSADRVFMTVWDGGGTDTYDMSNYGTNLNVDLRPGGWTTLSTSQIASLSGATAPGNVASALLYNGDLRSLIENAIGGGGNDVMMGNQVANTLTGNAGNDRLIGHSGNDTLLGGAGLDTLYGDELPVAPSAISLGAGTFNKTSTTGNTSIATAVNLNNLFSLASDPDIENATTTPHVSITASYDKTVDYYAVTINNAGAILTLDIDYGWFAGHLLDAVVRVYDSTGKQLTSNDDAPSTSGAGGSVILNGESLDSHLRFAIPSAGTYYFSVEGLTPQPTFAAGVTGYELQVSVSGELDPVADGSIVAGDDQLDGGLGSDMLYGGAGNDTLSGDGDAVPPPSGISLGSGSITKPVGQGNNSVANALDVSAAFSLANNADIGNATSVPHVTINGSTDGNIDYYRVNILNAGTVLTFDVDRALTTAGSQVDTELHLYGPTGAEVGDNDDMSSVDSGSASTLESLLSYTVTTPGVYTIGLGGFSNNGYTTLASGRTYQLHISVQGEYTGNGDDTLDGGEGNDTLAGNAGNDILLGGAGADSLNGGSGNDQMTGGTGDDVYYVDSLSDVVTEQSEQGLDEVRVSVDAYVLAAHAEVLRVVDGATVGAATGNALNNTIHGNALANTLNGGDGDDTINGGDGGDFLNGQAGNDQLFGDAGSDTLNGGDGDDVLDGGAGSDAMTGGAGNDTFRVDMDTDQVVEAEDGGIDTVQAYVGYVIGNGIENVTLMGSSDIFGSGSAGQNWMVGNAGNNFMGGGAGGDAIFAGNGNDYLKGDEGNDLLYGEAGNDVLEGNAGYDTLYGGIGDDRYIIWDLDDIIVEEASSGTDTVEAHIDNYVLYANIENVILSDGILSGSGNAYDNWMEGNAGNNFLGGGAGHDYLIGYAGNDYLKGDDGDDVLDAGAGDDYLEGNFGVDRMIGGDGNDTYYTDGPGDIIEETATGGIDTVYSTGFYTLSGNLENLVIVGTQAVDGTGDSGSNWMRGNDNNNVLSGMQGDDAIYGGLGNDTLAGGTGNDVLAGEGGADTYQFGRGDGQDALSENDATAGVNDVLAFGAGIAANQLWLQQSGNDLKIILTGAASADTMTITSWFSGAAFQVEQITAGGKTLTSSLVAALVSQLAASGAAPVAGTVTPTTAQQVALDTAASSFWRS